MSSSKGIFTGLITILPITGGTMPTIIVRGGTYAPSKTVSFNSFSISAIPPDYGFNTPLVTQQITNGGIFQPKIYISDVPSRFDVLSTGGL